ncbi:hypothetical protein Tco_0542733 [Tanacetum coccineum]
MDQIKQLDEGAYGYLIQSNHNSWSRAFFEMDMRCAAFENGISESFNRAILILRHKPIITMLEEIKLLDKKRREEQEREEINDYFNPANWREDSMEEAPFNQAYAEVLIPCIHNQPTKQSGVWVKDTTDVTFDDIGEAPAMTTSETTDVAEASVLEESLGHNKASCKADPIPKPTVEKKQPGRKKNVVVGHCASRGRGRGRGGSVNEASGNGMGGIDEANGSGMETSGGGTRDGGTSSRGGGTSSRGRGRGRRGGGTTSSGGRRGGGRGSRGVGSTRGGGMAGSSSMGILTAEEEYQVERDEEAFRECMQEQAREQAKIDAEQERLDKERREEQEREEMNDYFNPANWREDSMEEAPFNTKYAEVLIPSIHNLPTQQSGVWVKDTTDVTFEDIGEAPAMTTSETTDVAEASMLEESIVDKGKGKITCQISERIANMKLKKPFQFDKHGTGSTPEKAFDVDD